MSKSQHFSLALKNGFGIKDFKCEFDFSKSNVALIYAANGVMKSSFSRTMDCIAKGNRGEICDRLSGCKGSVMISVDGMVLDSRKHPNILVFSGDEYVGAGPSISAFLSDRETKTAYDDAVSHIKTVYGRLMSALSTAMGMDSCERLIMQLLHADEKTVYQKVVDLHGEVEKTVPYIGFTYGDVFDDKGEVEKFVQAHRVKLSRWAESYRKALSRSRVLGISKDGAFSGYEASSLAKMLGEDFFFNIGHKIEASCISVGLFDPDSGVKRCEHGARSAECSQRAA